MKNLLKYLFFLLVVKPFVYIVLGINVKNPENLPVDGPAIIVANHNSHIDTLVLMCLFPACMIGKINPVAAADYFFNTKFKCFVFKTLLGAIALKRRNEGFSKENIFEEINEKLKNGHILIVYPEGTRSMDSELQEFKTGVAHLVKSNSDVPVIPIYINGPDKVLPKYDAFFVPHICDIYIGEAMNYGCRNKQEFMQEIKDRVIALREEHRATHRQF